MISRFEKSVLGYFTGEEKLGMVRIIGTEFRKTGEGCRNQDSTVY